MTGHKPLVMTLDLATVSGYCVGRVGEKPRFGAWRLKSSEDAMDQASRNLGCRLRDELSLEIPDLIGIEAAMNPSGMLNKGNATGTVSLLWMLQGAVSAVAGCYGVRTKTYHCQTVRKAVLGNAYPENPKAEAMRYCKTMGYDVTIHDEADAILMWIFETSRYENRIAGATA
jgi:Holliday junction resolvasome RuvABC endonuclease subunit